MAKENKKSLIIWALVALVVGVILGLVITNLSTSGQAKEILGSKTEANVVEARQDLVLNLLKVNRIENRQNALQINSTSDIDVTASDSIELNTGISAINMYGNATDGPKIVFKTHIMHLKANEFRYYGLNQSSPSIVISPSTGDGMGGGIIMYDDVTINQLSAPQNSGNAYACVTSDGTLFRSQTPCNNSVFDILNQSNFYGGTLDNNRSCNDVCENPAIWGQSGLSSICIFAQFALTDPAYPGRIVNCGFTENNRPITCVCATP